MVKVLIADDEELERRAIRKILENEPGLEICEAGNGVEAWEVLSNGEVAVALLDIKMPGLDGIAVAERLRSEHAEVAIVFLTAYDQFDYARSALRLQVDDFLLKPASSAEVIQTLRRVLARVASLEGERQSQQAALFRLDGAIALLAQQLRHDLGGGLPDPDQVFKFLELRGLQRSLWAILECRPGQAGMPLAHVARLAEACFAGEYTVAVAGLSATAVRVLVVGPRPGDRDELRRFRERVRSETGCPILLGVAVGSDGTVHPDALVAAAHRASVVANPANPLIIVTVGAETETSAPEGRLTGSGTLPSTVTKALDLLERRLAEDLSLNEVAAEVGLSPSHLSRQLARATGNGFADCLAHFRIGAAKDYLATRTLTIKEVAHLVGFHDPAYFARVFRRLEGCSPADFRTAAEKSEGDI